MYLDQYLLADELGLHCMINEHHQTATCLNAAGPIPLAILARQTRNARLCILGNPAANLADPIRCAEEMAMIDNISYGRLDCGFVRGVPYELFASNANPTETQERLWETIDLVIRAWTSHDGPFNYEGKWIHKRQVNVWPRPYQQPHPPVWTTGGSDLSHACKTIERGHNFAMFLTPVDGLAKMFKGARQHTAATRGFPSPPTTSSPSCRWSRSARPRRRPRRSSTGCSGTSPTTNRSHSSARRPAITAARSMRTS